MKDFFKYVLATCVGLLLFGVVIGLLGVLSMVSMVAATSATSNVPKNSVLVLDLSGQMQEQSQDNVFSLLGEGEPTMGLSETLSAIRKAKDNDRIKGIYIQADGMAAGRAQLKELRDALKDFRKAGKWIIAYGDSYGLGEYYLASAADKVYVNPQGMISWNGLGGAAMYLKDALAQFGVKMQVFKIGRYKSATEMFADNEMSDFDRAQTSAYMSQGWALMCKEVSESRGVSVEKLNEAADKYMTFADQKDYLTYKLVDGLKFPDEVRDEVKKRLKLDEDEAISQVTVGDMQNVKEKNPGDQIAVYYAYGDIVDAPNPILSSSNRHQIVAKTLIDDFEGLAKDDDVKAVVIRVNSGGGSAYASEQIWRAVEKLKAKKPVVVSMGDMAASGGYYMSSGANWIVAEPTTITGSIGILAMIPDVSTLVNNKLKLHFTPLGTNRNSAFGIPSRPFNAEETQMLQGYIQRGYDVFRSRVAKGRKMTMERVHELGEGHVYTGTDALKLKLVDQLGGLDVALAKAASLAKLKEYHATEYPGAVDFLDQLTASQDQGTILDEKLRAVMGQYYEPFMSALSLQGQDILQARLPYYIMWK